MKLFTTTVFLTLLTVPALSLQASFAAPQQKIALSTATVIPGKSLGRINLGWSPAQVRRILGKPDKALQLRGGLSDDLYLAKKTRTDPNGTMVRDKLEVLYRRGKVVQIEATSPTFKILDGLATSSTFRQISRSQFDWRVLVYGYSREESAWQNFYLVDQKKGVTIEFQGWQENLMDHSTPTTIIVHRAGTRVIPDVGGKLVTDSLDLSVVMSRYD